MSENIEEEKQPAEKADEMKELSHIAANLKLPEKLRTDAIKQLGNTPTHEAFLTLLDIAANDRLITKERALALKQARELLKKISL